MLCSIVSGSGAWQFMIPIEFELSSGGSLMRWAAALGATSLYGVNPHLRSRSGLVVGDEIPWPRYRTELIRLEVLCTTPSLLLVLALFPTQYQIVLIAQPSLQSVRILLFYAPHFC